MRAEIKPVAGEEHGAGGRWQAAGEAEKSVERGQGRGQQVLHQRCWQTMPQGIGAISAQLIDLRHFLSGQSTGEEQQEE